MHIRQQGEHLIARHATHTLYLECISGGRTEAESKIYYTFLTKPFYQKKVSGGNTQYPSVKTLHVKRLREVPRARNRAS